MKLDFAPEIPPTFVLPPDSHLLEIPTAPTGMEKIQAAAQNIVRRLETIDLERLVKAASGAVEAFERLAKSPALQQTVDALPGTVSNVNGTVTSLRELLERVDQEQAPLLTSLRSTSEKTGATLQTLHAMLAPNAPLAVDLATALREVTAAAHSVRLLADSLERNPSAIVRGTEVEAK